MTDQITQWLRWVEVIVGKGGTGLDLRTTHQDGLRISFKVEKTIRHTPNQANIMIYNLHPDDEKKVLEEFDDVIINTGYQQRQPTAQERADAPQLYGARVVFRGNIKRAFAWWDKGDRITEIQAADGDRDYRQAVVNYALPAGTTASDEIAAIGRAFTSTSVGVAQVAGTKRKRGKVIHGAARDVLHRLAHENDANWSIQDGKLEVVQSTGVLPTEAVVVNEETGMIGAPEISDKGVRVTCLLNPFIEINGKLLLRNNDIKIQETQLYTNGPKTKAKNLVRLSPDGVYKVYKLDHAGDTHADEFTSVAECVALGEAIPPQGARKPMVHL